MKERRFKIVYISDNIVATWGKHITKEVKEQLPEGAVILNQEHDFSRASLTLLIHHENFPIIAAGEKVPKMILDIKPNEKPKLIYNH